MACESKAKRRGTCNLLFQSVPVSSRGGTYAMGINDSSNANPPVGEWLLTDLQAKRGNDALYGRCVVLFK